MFNPYILFPTIPQLSIFISANGTYAKPDEELPCAEESRSTPRESTHIQDTSHSSLSLEYLSCKILPAFIGLRMTTDSDLINEEVG